MPFFVHENVMLYGLVYIKNNANHVALVHTYDTSHSYATVWGNRLASYTSGSGDFVIGSVGLDRRVGTNDVLATAYDSTPAEFSLHVVCLDTANEHVVWATQCLVNRDVISGQTIIIPAAIHTVRQPVAAI